MRRAIDSCNYAACDREQIEVQSARRQPTQLQEKVGFTKKEGERKKEEEGRRDSVPYFLGI